MVLNGLVVVEQADKFLTKLRGNRSAASVLQIAAALGPATDQITPVIPPPGTPGGAPDTVPK